MNPLLRCTTIVMYEEDAHRSNVSFALMVDLSSSLQNGPLSLSTPDLPQSLLSGTLPGVVV
jgi:hypothetical protein